MVINGRHFICALAGIAALALCSCESGGGAGRVVNYPTVDEMARIDREMGLDSKGKSNNSRSSTPEHSNITSAPQRSQPAAQPQLQPIDSPATQPPPGLPALPPNSTLR